MHLIDHIPFLLPSLCQTNSYIDFAINQGKANAFSQIKSIKENLFFANALINEEEESLTFMGKTHSLSIGEMSNNFTILDLRKKTSKQKIVTIAVTVAVLAISILISFTLSGLILSTTLSILALALGIFLGIHVDSYKKNILKKSQELEKEIEQNFLEKSRAVQASIRQKQARIIKQIIEYSLEKSKVNNNTKRKSANCPSGKEFFN